MKRKVQITGKSTFIVSLPKKWVKEVGLARGQEVEMKILKDSLVIKVSKDSKNFRVIDGNKVKNKEILLRKILTSYFDGVKEIKVINVNPLLVKKATAKLMGLEVVEEGKDFIVLRDVLNICELPVKKVLKRMLSVIRSMVNLLKSGELQLLHTLDDEVDKLYFLVVRQLRRAVVDPEFSEKIDITPIECLDYRVVAKELEEIADEIVSLSKENEVKDITFLDKIMELLSLSLKSLLENNIELANHVRREINKLKKTCPKKFLNIAERAADISDIVSK